MDKVSFFRSVYNHQNVNTKMTAEAIRESIDTTKDYLKSQGLSEDYINENYKERANHRGMELSNGGFAINADYYAVTRPNDNKIDVFFKYNGKNIHIELDGNNFNLSFSPENMQNLLDTNGIQNYIQSEIDKYINNAANIDKSDSKEDVTMSTGSFAEILETFSNFKNDFYKIMLGITNYDSKDIDTDIELISQKGYENLTEEEKEYKETLMIASGQQKEFSTDMELISQRMDTYTKFLNHLIKAKYPNMSDEQIDSSISKAKGDILDDLQNGKLPINKYEEGYNIRNVLHMFQGLVIGYANSQK